MRSKNGAPLKVERRGGKRVGAGRKVENGTEQKNIRMYPEDKIRFAAIAKAKNMIEADLFRALLSYENQIVARKSE